MAKAKLNSDLLLKYQNFSKFGLVTSAFIHTYKIISLKKYCLFLSMMHTLYLSWWEGKIWKKKKKQHSRLGRKSPLSGNGRMLSTKYYWSIGNNKGTCRLPRRSFPPGKWTQEVWWGKKKEMWARVRITKGSNKQNLSICSNSEQASLSFLPLKFYKIVLILVSRTSMWNFHVGINQLICYGFFSCSVMHKNHSSSRL